MTNNMPAAMTMAAAVAFVLLSANTLTSLIKADNTILSFNMSLISSLVIPYKSSLQILFDFLRSLPQRGARGICWRWWNMTLTARMRSS